MILRITVQHYSFICTQLNGSKYYYLAQIILFSINHLSALI